MHLVQCHDNYLTVKLINSNGFNFKARYNTIVFLNNNKKTESYR